MARNLSFYHPAVRNSQNLISPDIAVFVGLALPPQEQRRVTSWEMRPSEGPAPTSGAHGGLRGEQREHLEDGHRPRGGAQALAVRPDGRAGVLCLRPQRPAGVAGSQRQRLGRRLLGWRYDAAGQPVALEPDAEGRLWSAALDSWLVPDEELLRFYDATGALRLTPDEAAAAQAEAAAAQAEAAAAQAQRERRARLEAEERQRQEAQWRLDAEEGQRQEARRRLQAEQRAASPGS